MFLGIKWTWKKIAGTVCGVFGIGTLVSCYGMPEDYSETQKDYLVIYGNVTGADKRAIPGIFVRLVLKTSSMATDTTTTDENGGFRFSKLSENSNFRLEFRDIDGAENGSFDSKELEVSLNQGSVKLDVLLSEKTLENENQ